MWGGHENQIASCTRSASKLIQNKGIIDEDWAGAGLREEVWCQDRICHNYGHRLTFARSRTCYKWVLPQRQDSCTPIVWS